MVIALRRRYRLPRGPQRSARSWYIQNREGRYLSNPKVPFTWTDREMMALSFLTREEAVSFINRRFVSEVAARQLAGIRVV